MNILNNCNETEIKLLKNIGIELKDKEYSSEELRKYETEIESFIMSQSTKNGDLDKAMRNYSGILRKLVNQ